MNIIVEPVVTAIAFVDTIGSRQTPLDASIKPVAVVRLLVCPTRYGIVLFDCDTISAYRAWGGTVTVVAFAIPAPKVVRVIVAGDVELENETLTVSEPSGRPEIVPETFRSAVVATTVSVHVSDTVHPYGASRQDEPLSGLQLPEGQP